MKYVLIKDLVRSKFYMKINENFSNLRRNEKLYKSVINHMITHKTLKEYDKYFANNLLLVDDVPYLIMFLCKFSKKNNAYNIKILIHNPFLYGTFIFDDKKCIKDNKYYNMTMDEYLENFRSKIQKIELEDINIRNISARYSRRYLELDQDLFSDSVYDYKSTLEILSNYISIFNDSFRVEKELLKSVVKKRL